HGVHEHLLKKARGNATVSSLAGQENMEGQDHTGGDGPHKALQQVGSQSSHVTYVVANVIGDGRGVARVVFRDTRLHLTHQVSSHIRCLGVDSTAHPEEHSHDRAAQDIPG